MKAGRSMVKWQFHVTDKLVRSWNASFRYFRPAPYSTLAKQSLFHTALIAPPLQCLIQMGVFSSTPIKPPKWGFDINLLEHMSLQFTFGVPNMTAWCHATVAFLQSQGVEEVPSPVGAHKPPISGSADYHSHTGCITLASKVRSPALSDHKALGEKSGH